MIRKSLLPLEVSCPWTAARHLRVWTSNGIRKIYFASLHYFSKKTSSPRGELAQSIYLNGILMSNVDKTAVPSETFSCILKQMFFKKIFSLFILVSLLVPSFSRAEEVKQSCFDFYSYGSAEMDIRSGAGKVAAGTVTSFFGTVKNKGSFPLVDGEILVKIIREDGTTVERFTADSGINLLPGKEKEISFDWKVSAFAPSGDYRMEAYFISSKKFEISGTVFSFKVAGQEKSGVSLIKGSLEVAGDAVKRAEVSLINRTSKVEIVPVVWSLYKDNNLDPKNLIDFRRDYVRIGAGEKKKAEYDISAGPAPQYFLIAETEYNGIRSSEDLAFEGSGESEARIFFASLMDYPLREGKENAVFVCLNTTGGRVESQNLSVMIKDPKGGIIHSYKYNGPAGDGVSLLKSDFTPKRDWSEALVSVAIEKGGFRIIDAVSLQYDCDSLSPDNCKSGGNEDKSIPVAEVFAVAAMIIIAFIAVEYVIKKKYAQNI